LRERDRAEDSGPHPQLRQRDVVGDVVPHGGRFEIPVHEREHVAPHEVEQPVVMGDTAADDDALR
jgi:hypothetical protein